MNVTLAGMSKHKVPVLLGGDRVYSSAKAAKLDFTESNRALPYDQLAVAHKAQPYRAKVDASGAYAGPASDIVTLQVLMDRITKENEAYIKEMVDYYDRRVSRTSGGKRDRLRDERAMLRNEAEAAIRLAQSIIMEFRQKAIAQVKATSVVDPDAIVVVPNSTSGRREYTTSTATPGTTAAAREAAPSAGLNPTLLLIPAGLVAAYFLAKG